MSKTECLFRIRVKNLPQYRVKSDRAKRVDRARKNVALVRQWRKEQEDKSK